VPGLQYWAPGRPRGSSQRAQPPTLAVEVRSPGQSMESLREKCELMRAHGVDVRWLIDPEARRVEVFEASDVAKPAQGADLRSAVLPGLTISLADLWSVLDR